MGVYVYTEQNELRFEHVCKETCKKLCIKGHHIYHEQWVPVIGEELEGQRERSNPTDA